MLKSMIFWFYNVLTKKALPRKRFFFVVITIPYAAESAKWRKW